MSRPTSRQVRSPLLPFSPRTPYALLALPWTDDVCDLEDQNTGPSHPLRRPTYWSRAPTYLGPLLDETHTPPHPSPTPSPVSTGGERWKVKGAEEVPRTNPLRVVHSAPVSDQLVVHCPDTDPSRPEFLSAPGSVTVCSRVGLR